MPILSPLAAREIVIITTFTTNNDGNILHHDNPVFSINIVYKFIQIIIMHELRHNIR